MWERERERGRGGRMKENVGECGRGGERGCRVREMEGRGGERGRGGRMMERWRQREKCENEG